MHAQGHEGNGRKPRGGILECSEGERHAFCQQHDEAQASHVTCVHVASHVTCVHVAMVLCALHNFIEGTGDVIPLNELAACDFVASHVLANAGKRSGPDDVGAYLIREKLAPYAARMLRIAPVTGVIPSYYY